MSSFMYIHKHISSKLVQHLTVWNTSQHASDCCIIYSTQNILTVFTQYASLLTDITHSSHTHPTDKNSQYGPMDFISLQKSEILQIRTCIIPLVNWSIM